MGEGVWGCRRPVYTGRAAIADVQRSIQELSAFKHDVFDNPDASLRDALARLVVLDAASDDLTGLLAKQGIREGLKGNWRMCVGAAASCK